MPAQKQALPERKTCCGKKKRVADVTKRRTMVTRSMRREKVKRQDLCDAVKNLPNLSGILIQAINLCKSAKGLSFTTLKEVLGARGYDVSRYCPSIKRQLKSLASKGALVRMTHKAGSTFFVIRKHQGKEVATEGAPEKMKETTKQGKKSGLQAVQGSRKGQRSTSKWKPGKKKPRQPPGQISPSKASQRPIKKTLSTVERSNSSATDTVPATKRRYYSWGKPASSRKSVRYLRSTNANATKKSGSPFSQARPKRARSSSSGVTVSEKRQGSSYGPPAHNTRAHKYSRNKTPSTGQGGGKPKGKASSHASRSSSRATPNTKRSRRI